MEEFMTHLVFYQYFEQMQIYKAMAEKIVSIFKLQYSELTEESHKTFDSSLPIGQY